MGLDRGASTTMDSHPLRQVLCEQGSPAIGIPSGGNRGCQSQSPTKLGVLSLVSPGYK